MSRRGTGRPSTVHALAGLRGAALLHGVRQFVPEEVAAASAVHLIPARIKRDVLANRVAEGVNSAS